MKIEYTLETKDLIALALFHRANWKPKVNGNIFWYGMLPILMCALVLTTGASFSVMSLIFGLFIGSFMLWQNWCARKNLEDRSSRENAGDLLGKYWMELTPDWLIVSTEASEGRYRWSRPKRAVFTATHVFVVLNNLQAFVVPRRAFLNEASFQTFKTEFKNHLDNSRKAAATNSP
jgi:hypothetical protein